MTVNVGGLNNVYTWLFFFSYYLSTFLKIIGNKMIWVSNIVDTLHYLFSLIQNVLQLIEQVNIP